MEKDKLEKYIQDHREDFDQETPPSLIWSDIEKELDEEDSSRKVVRMRTPGIMRIMQIAAMFVVVMGVGLLIGLQINDNKVNPQIQEFVEAEKHYSREIDKMWMVVNTSDIEGKEGVQEDLNALDAIYNELKNEMITNPNANTDYVINAMINNYRAKIDILETVLNKYNSEKTNNQQINLDDDDKVEI